MLLRRVAHLFGHFRGKADSPAASLAGQAAETATNRAAARQLESDQTLLAPAAAEARIFLPSPRLDKKLPASCSRGIRIIIADRRICRLKAERRKAPMGDSDCGRHVEHRSFAAGVAQA